VAEDDIFEDDIFVNDDDMPRQMSYSQSYFIPEQPTEDPTYAPIENPMVSPSISPTADPSANPTAQPSANPTADATSNPSANPTAEPSENPTASTSDNPTVSPSEEPTASPTTNPTCQPSEDPTEAPTSVPTTATPTASPTLTPTYQEGSPTPEPIASPTANPTVSPTSNPTASPTVSPTVAPTASPIASPTADPTAEPTTSPTAAPTATPTATPTEFPTSMPSWNYYDYVDTFVYNKYLESMNVDLGFNFSTFNYKGRNVGDGGTCEVWKGFVASQLNLPFDYVFFSSLGATFANYDFDTDVTFNNSMSCNNKNDALSIVNNFNNDNSNAPLSQSCDGHDFKIIHCSLGPIMCVDCDTSSEESICGMATSCAGYGENMIINPCQVCSEHISTTGSIYFGIDIEILYPRIIENSPSVTMVTTPSKNSMSINLNVSKVGVVYCAALFENTNITSEYVVIEADYFTTIFSQESAGDTTVEITDLVPESNYDVYCYTQDFNNHVMTFDAVLATKTSVSTLCCREIFIESSHAETVEYISGTTSDEKLFEFALETIPLETTDVNVTLVTYDCGAVENIATSIADAFPSSFTFTTTSLSLQNDFIVRGSPGCYNLTISATSGTIYQNYTSMLKINSIFEEPTAPQVKSATFGNKGIDVYISMDSPTDQSPGLFTCSNLLSFTGDSLADCLWTSNKDIVVSLGTTGTIEIGDSIDMKVNLIKAACPTGLVCDYAFAEASSTTLLAPIKATVPAVSLTTSKVITTCDEVSLDPTRSTGNGGRSWQSIEWSVTLDSVIDTEITNFLNKNYTDDSFSVAKIPSSMTTPGSYSFKLTLTNFLNKKSLYVVSNTITGLSTTPSVSIPGLAIILTYRKDSISIFANAKLPSCPGQSQIPINYVWEVYYGLTFQSSIFSISKDPRYFKLDPYILNSESTYTVAVKVYTGAVATNYSLTSVLVQLGKSNVVANIAGGASRSASSSEILTLDASISYDIDYPTTQSILSYKWQCVEVSPSFGTLCPDFGVSSTTSIMNIPALQFEESVTKKYSFTVFVTSGSTTASSKSLITVLSEAIPKIIIGSSAVKYNPDTKIILTSAVTTIGDVWASWSSSNIDDSTLDSFALTSLTKASTTAGTFEYQLAISTNTLTPGLTYSFQLGATYDSALGVSNTYDSFASKSIVDVIINEAPKYGSIIVSPTIGEALTTEYVFSTISWTDDGDYPLNYILSYYQVSADSEIVVKTEDANSMVTTILGQGLQNNGYVITCAAVAIDSYGSSSDSALTTIVVNPLVNATEVAIITRKKITEAQISGNVDGVGQSVGGATSSANSVNCSLATDCASLNRAECSTTINTCGLCLETYISGITGPSNVECFSNSRRLVENGGSSCTGNDDCYSGYCNSNSICAYQAKTCTNDCSNSGTCLSYDYENNVIESDVCLSNNAHCHVACICSVNSYGDDCSQDEENFIAKQNLREELCQAVYETLPVQDVTIDVVISRSTSVANTLLFTSEITANATKYCAYALIETINSYPELAGTPSAASLCLQALSFVISKENNAVTTTLIDDVSSAIKSLTVGIQSNLAIGEAASEYFESNIRLSTSLADPSLISSQTFSAPLTSVEIMDNEMTTIVSTTSEVGSDVTSISISILEYSMNPRNIDTDSYVVGVQVVENYGADSGSGSVDTNVVLQNVVPVDYYHEDFMNGSIACDPENVDTYNINITCPNGDVLSLECPSDSYGRVYTYYCPHITEFPYCQLWDGIDFITDSDCHVIDFSNDNTTCSCNVDVNNPSRRKLDYASSSDIFEIGSKKIRSTSVQFIEFLDAPTYQPTSLPTSFPTSLPSTVPSSVPTHPTFHPTPRPTNVGDININPTLQPTLFPTIFPTEIPTTSPTLIQEYTIISFTSTIEMTGFSSQILDDISKLAIRNATAISMSVDMSEIIIKEYNFYSSRRRILNEKLRGSIDNKIKLESTNILSIVLIITINMNNYRQFSSPTTLYNTLTSSLTESISNGAYSTTLQQIATTSGSSLLINVSVDSVINDEPIIKLPYLETNNNNDNQSFVLFIVIGIIIGLIIVISTFLFTKKGGKIMIYDKYVSTTKTEEQTSVTIDDDYVNNIIEIKPIENIKSIGILDEKAKPKLKIKPIKIYKKLGNIEIKMIPEKNLLRSIPILFPSLADSNHLNISNQTNQTISSKYELINKIGEDFKSFNNNKINNNEKNNNNEINNNEINNNEITSKFERIGRKRKIRYKVTKNLVVKN
jgi:hypothetical protein